MPGASRDGHDFAAGAAEAGAAALVVESALPVNLPQLVVPEVRAAVGPLALAGAGSPQEHLQLAGVTGTNGKTTVTHLLSSILEGAGRRCVAIGTLSGTLTTPRATELAGRLASARADGAGAAVLEVSSHGLFQKRVEGLRFAAAAFTNLSPEHLDYHGDMEAYYRVKRSLFSDARTSLSVVCTDDRWGRRLAAELTGEVRRCSQDDAEVLVGGPTALQTDAWASVNTDVRFVGPIVVVLIWIILLVLLRSLVAATYLIGSVLLSFLSALGISVVIFQNLMGHPGVGYQNAVWMFIFLAALGADYNILIMTRVREEIRARGLIEGTRLAVARTGGVITSAGLILAGTFSILATLPLRDIFQLGFAVMLGVLLDTFVVRALFVPSLVILLRRWNWWPVRLKSPSSAEADAS